MAQIMPTGDWRLSLTLEATVVDGMVQAMAVGTTLTGGPPRRSQRALLTHWAPALDTNVEAHGGEGVLDAGGG